MSAAQYLQPAGRGAGAVSLCLALQPLVACAELAAGAPAERVAEPQVAAQARSGAVSPFLRPAPRVFEATGTAVWDGRRTLRGIWVAHPDATSARRVRIVNERTGAAVDGALFERDATLTGPTVLVSSDAAELLGMQPDEEVDLRIVAVEPAQIADATTGDWDAPTAEMETSAAAEKRRPAPAVESADAEVPQPAAVAVAGPAEGPAPATAGVAVATSQPAAESPWDEGPSDDLAPRDVAAAAPQPAVLRPVALQPSTPPPAPAATGKPSRPSRPPQDDGAATPFDTGELAPRPAGPAQPEAVAPAASPLDMPYVQAGLFGVSGNAERLIERLRDADLPALGKPLRSRGRSYTRVLVGPFMTLGERAEARRRIRRMGLTDAIPVKR